MTKITSSSKHSKLPYAIGAVIVLMVAVGAYIYQVNHEQKPIVTLNQYTKGQTNKTSSSNNSSGQSVNSASSSKTEGTGTALVAPFGNFVSNHSPNLSGSPDPNSMTSVCNTSPGASCQITFTKGSTTKSLPKQVTDAGGTTYWFWKLQDIGLTTGSWTVTATSNSGDKSLSAKDPSNLVVAQ